MKDKGGVEWGDMTYECSYCGEQHSEAISCPKLIKVENKMKYRKLDITYMDGTFQTWNLRYPMEVQEMYNNLRHTVDGWTSIATFLGVLLVRASEVRSFRLHDELEEAK